MTRRIATLGSLLLVLGILAAARPTAEPEPRFFELRTYTTHEGKLDFLNKRFREHTNGLFVKHGMELVGYWMPTEGDLAGHTLIYVLAYPSREARDASWHAFTSDPEWQEVYRASHEEAGGPIVAKVESVFMTATDYSPIR